MAQTSGAPQRYCAVCGSCEMTPVTVHQEYDSRKTLKPAVGAGGVKVSLGSIKAGAARGMTYSAVMCLICRNTAGGESSGTRPLEVTMSDYDRIIVIPYRLAIVLLDLCDESEIVSTLRQCRRRFDRIFDEWSRSGSNICRKCRVGQKLRIRARGTILYCWVIIDYSEKFYVRLSYGGGKIQCP